MYEEDHTIGNSIKHILSRMCVFQKKIKNRQKCEFRDEVEFCGYNVPHPLEDKILFRVQTKEGVNALEVLVKAFESVEQVYQIFQDCNIYLYFLQIFSTIRGKFEKAYEQS